jgi:protein gp37
VADQRDGGIAWTDTTWNPTRGCSRVSKGCENCYAEGVARRFSGSGQPYEGLVRLDREGKAKAQWNGVVRLVPEHLFDPLRWTRPRRIFVNSMSDLFHEALAFEDVAAIFGVMAACPQHTFQVLTKRPERAAEFFAWAEAQDEALTRGSHPGGDDVCTPGLLNCVSAALAAEVRIHPEGDGGPLHTKRCADPGGAWPLPNVDLLVSVEDQATADERIPILLTLPAARRGVSYEPAIGPVDFDACDAFGVPASEGCPDPSFNHGPMRGIDWIIVGGESGPGARPFDLAWARSTIAQCRAAGVSVFCKQIGAVPHIGSGGAGWADGTRGRHWRMDDPTTDPLTIYEVRDRKGGDMDEWPEDLRVREFPATQERAEATK